MTRIAVELPSGEVTVRAALALPAGAPTAALALAHGAGAGMDHPFLVGVAEALCEAGIATLRFDFPYREVGRRMPGPATHAITTWTAVMAELSRAVPGGSSVPRIAAGKSYGGRMASMAAADGAITPDGLVYLGYPFHPPGKPDAPRSAHLARIAAPQLFVEGTVDPFIQPIAQFEQAVGACSDADIAWIGGGRHSFEVTGARRPPEQIGADLASVVVGWVRTLPRIR